MQEGKGPHGPNVEREGPKEGRGTRAQGPMKKRKDPRAQDPRAQDPNEASEGLWDPLEEIL